MEGIFSPSFLVMQITGTHINYYRICRRKLWLFANDIQLEHTSDMVSDGKIIEEESYQQRSERYTQLELSALYQDIYLTGKIDFYDTRDQVVHETKRSNKVEQAHIWQVKFYLWLLKLNGIEAEHGIIEYPRLRERETVHLDEEDIAYLEKTVEEIKEVINHEACPPTINARICRSCSYADFCYVGEEVRE